ncbi:MAG: molybdenum cofactor guanylyltransferase [Promethearchaeota archaeon]
MDFHVGILAGGLFRRFGSNKATFKINGKPIILKLIEEVPKLTIKPRNLMISIHDQAQLEEIKNILEKVVNDYEENNIIRFSIYDNNKFKINDIPISFILDDHEISSGREDDRAPIFGLLSIFLEARKGFIQVLPCDSPNIKARFLNFIYEKAKFPQLKYDAIIARWNNGYIEPLHGLFRPENFIDAIKQNIKKRDYKLVNFIRDKNNIRYVSVEKEISLIDPTLSLFKNINTKDGL